MSSRYNPQAYAMYMVTVKEATSNRIDSLYRVWALNENHAKRCVIVTENVQTPNYEVTAVPVNVELYETPDIDGRMIDEA